MSAPMPNPFLSNSVSHVPVDAGSAAVSSSPPQQTAAEAISDDADNTDHINEIFFYARKLIADGRRFVLDEAAFMAAVDEEPLFLRSAV